MSNDKASGCKCILPKTKVEQDKTMSVNAERKTIIWLIFYCEDNIFNSPLKYSANGVNNLI